LKNQPTDGTAAADRSPAAAAPPAGEAPQRAFLTHTAWTFGARLLMAANSLLAGVIIARWLGAASFGVFAVINVTVGNAVQFGGAGLTAANTYFVSRERSRFTQAALNAAIYALTGGVALACATALVARLAPSLFDDVPLELLAIALGAVPFQLLILLGLNLFLVVGAVTHYNLLDLLGQSFILINAVLALVLLRAGLLTLVCLNTAASVCVSLLVGWLIYRRVEAGREEAAWRPNLDLFRRMIRYGLKYNVLMIATTLVLRADLLIVNALGGAAEAGVYAVASQGALLLMVLPNVIGSLLFPRVASSRDEGGEMTSMVARHTALVMLLACLAAVPVSFALPLLYGAAFADATIQFLILLPGVFLFGLEMVLVQHFVGRGLPRAVPAFWLATLAVSLWLNLALVPRFGARGAAFASTVSYALVFALVALYFRRATRQPLSSIWLVSRAELATLLGRLRATRP
jgi:O-antigen/teichoic acid export membrane protein